MAQLTIISISWRFRLIQINIHSNCISYLVSGVVGETAVRHQLLQVNRHWRLCQDNTKRGRIWCWCISLYIPIHTVCKQPIRARILGHVTGYQPIRDQYFLIRSVSVTHPHHPSSLSLSGFSSCPKWKINTNRVFSAASSERHISRHLYPIL